MPFDTIVLFVAGFVLLIMGAELLVRGASRLATAIGVSRLVIGLTVVAYGTSAPEIAVTLRSVFDVPARPDLAIGNVVGSNISNILLVLGISAVVMPLVVSRHLVRITLPLMISVSALFWYFAADGYVSRGEGAVLFAGAILYSLVSILGGRRIEARRNAAKSESEKPAFSARRATVDLGEIVVGLILLVLGSQWLVDGAVVVAELLEVSELVIGLTVVAVGTSLPEIATSVVAGLRGHRDIAVGTVIGSNLFNILLVLGLCALIAPNPVTVSASALRFDIPIMFTVALACWPILFTGWIITRWEGLALLVYYAAYTLFLYLQATQHEALEEYRLAMLCFILPLTGLVLLIMASRFWHHRDQHQQDSANVS